MTDDLYTLTQEDAHKLAMYGELPALPPLPPLNGDGDQDHAFTIAVTTARDLCAEPDTGSGQMLGPLLLQGGRTIIVGDTGQGKTTLAFQLIKAALDEQPFLDWSGAAGGGRALVVDLEQGRRSVKRGLRDSGLEHRDDVDLVLVPDGLSLDRSPEQIVELDRVIAAGGYTIVNLDPYYKAHRADEPNAERPIVDLMRTLDQLRARHGFALILPAHPRKDAVGASPVRKLTIHDIAGSGAVTRGAEVVIAIERVAHGLARLRFLKDREGDLPIGEAWHLHYTKTAGFTRDPKDKEAPRNYKIEILDLSGDGEWRTIRDYMDTLKAGDKPIRAELRDLVAQGRFEYQVGPEGRTRSAKCWRVNAAFTPSMQTHLEIEENHKGSGALDHLNAPDAPMHTFTTSKSAASISDPPNAPMQTDHFPSEDRTTASGVFPVRGSTQDEVGGTSPESLHSPPECTPPLDDADLELLATTVDLDQTAGTLDADDANDDIDFGA